MEHCKPHATFCATVLSLTQSRSLLLLEIEVTL